MKVKLSHILLTVLAALLTLTLSAQNRPVRGTVLDQGGEPLVGHAALVDTMKDLVVDSLGALVVSLIGYVSLKHKKGWVEKLLLKFKASKPEQAHIHNQEDSKV